MKSKPMLILLVGLAGCGAASVPVTEAPRPVDTPVPQELDIVVDDVNQLAGLLAKDLLNDDEILRRVMLRRDLLPSDREEAKNIMSLVLARKESLRRHVAVTLLMDDELSGWVSTIKDKDDDPIRKAALARRIQAEVECLMHMCITIAKFLDS